MSSASSSSILAQDHDAEPVQAGGLLSLLEERALSARFQPIVDLRSASVYGHESLVRGPARTPLALPDALFEAARRASLVTTLEFECIRVALQTWAHKRAPGKLFVNLSASALSSAFGGSRLESSMDFLTRCAVPASALVIELTEHEQVHDIEGLHGVIDLLRLHGVQLALDDFGDGRSSLRLWSELRPDYVKIDKYFTNGVADDPNKLQTFRAMLQIAETFGAQLIAEGIETAAQLRVLRDLEVRYGQGWFLGKPRVEPVSEPLAQASEVLQGRDIAVLPELRTAGHRRVTVAQLLVQAPVVGPETTHDELFRMISEHEGLQAVAVVQDGQPLALIDCQQFVNRYARPFFKELYGRHSCLKFAGTAPPTVDLNAGIEQLTSLLTAGDQRYLREGFIITENGSYRGLGTGEALVKAVTETRVEAARRANPLTFLPGNIPVSQHIERLLGSGETFAVAHADLNDFKSYNDHYGYWRGDEMIRLAASVISAACDPGRDFVGHVGGDDFVVVFQSEDWRGRCERIARLFNERALGLFDPEARAAGGIVAEDRQGTRRFYPCTTISIGIAQVSGAGFHSAEEVSAAAAAAKHVAKRQAIGWYQLETDVAV